MARVSPRRFRAAVEPVLLAVLALVAHRPAAMLRMPYWLDEAWVADSVREPLSSLRDLTSSTPIGFSLLLRLVPPVGPVERLRVVPLAFAVLLGPLGWWLGRELDRDSRLTGYATGVAAAVLPAGLLRHDLKQYTADAAVAVLLLLLGARAERLRTHRALAILGGTAAGAAFVSHTTLLVAAAVFGGLVLAALVQRDWRHAVEATVAGTATGAWLGAVYLAFARHAETPALTEYWRAYYVPGNGSARFVADRAGDALGLVGVGPPVVAALLILAGLALLARARRPATALMLPLLTLVTLVAARARAYPLWETRTSLFYLALGTMLAAYAVGRAAASLGRRFGAIPLAVGAVLLAQAALPNARTTVPYENSRGFARRVAAEAGPDDAILVHADTAYAWAFYWHADRATFVPDESRAVGFAAAYPPGSRVTIVTPDDAGPAIDAAFARGAPAVWLVLVHTHAGDNQTYQYVAADRGRMTTVDDVGGLLLRVERTG